MPFTEAEEDILSDMLTYDIRDGSRPALLINTPTFKEYMHKIRPGTDIKGLTPPTITVKFNNSFSKRFTRDYPTFALMVNNRPMGRIKTGTTRYKELTLWS